MSVRQHVCDASGLRAKRVSAEYVNYYAVSLGVILILFFVTAESDQITICSHWSYQRNLRGVRRLQRVFG